jgi:hypothetical protein
VKGKQSKPQQERKPMITKHYRKTIVRAALLLALTMCITGIGPLFSSSARAGSFSISDVSGNYVDHGNGWLLGVGGTNDKQSVPFSFVSLITFTPATGTFHADVITREYATNLHPVFDGTYTVDATGHGTMTWRNGEKHRDFYIVNGGAELKFINTDPPGTAVVSSSGTMTKQ